MGGYFWTNKDRVAQSKRRFGRQIGAGYVPSLLPYKPGFFANYGPQCLGAVVVSIVSFVILMVYGHSFMLLGVGGFWYVIPLAFAVVAGMLLPVHYYLRYRRMEHAMRLSSAPGENEPR